ncbi:MAG: hypothetical protein IKY71_03765 [Bacteroidaceae bacterium]|nr:hypothetical protein [Bacteroidaceae bacterium]
MTCHQLSGNSLSFPLLRLTEQYERNKQLIIAYDIDDTVRPFHSATCSQVVSTVRAAKNVLGAYLIVYTSNPDIDGVRQYLDDNDIPYDSINENAPFAPQSNGKLYYNLLLDDKAGLAQAESVLRDLIYLVINKHITKEDV